MGKIDKVELMTLGTFEVTEQNAAEYAVCEALIRDPNTYRLVVLCLRANERFHAINALRNEWSNMDVLCADSQDFANDLVNEIRKSRRPVDLNKYKERDILILDDIHRIFSKVSTEAELYRVLKYRLQEKKLTIIFCDRPVENYRSKLLHSDLIEFLSLGRHSEEE